MNPTSLSNASLERIKQLADLAPCGIGLYQAGSLTPVFYNAAFYRLLGYEPGETERMLEELDALFSPQDPEDARRNRELLARKGGAAAAEYRFLRRDGQARWAQVELAAVEIAGQSCVFASFTDITREKEIASQLSLTAENVGSSLSLIRVTEHEEELIYGNSAFFRNVGLERERYKGSMLFFNRAFVTDEDHERILRAAHEARSTGEPQELTHRFLRPDGRVFWLHRRFAAVAEDTPGSYLLVSVVTDVTSEHEAALEKALEQRRFQTVIRELNAAVFEWNHKTGEFFSSEAYQNYAISDVPNEDILQNRGPAEAVHPDDGEQMRRFFEQTRSGQRRAEVTLRLKLKSGAYHWCRMIGLYDREEDGTPSRTVGVIIDVNEERERSFMLNSLLNEIPGGVAIFTFDTQLRCQYFNDGYARLSNRTRAEVDELLQKDALLQSVVAPADYDRLVQTLRNACAVGAPINCTFRYLTREGEMRWVHLSATKMREENGNPVYYCVHTIPTLETALYRSIVEDSPVGVLVAERATRNVLYLNDVAAQMCGFQQEQEILGRSIVDVLRQAGKNPLLSVSELAILKDDRYEEFSYDRPPRYYVVKAKALSWNGVDSYILYIADETGEHERQLRLQKLIDEVPAGIGIYDVDGSRISLVYLNDAYYELGGMRREDRRQYYGEHTLDAIYPEDRHTVEETVLRLLAGENKGSLLTRLRNGAGEWRWMNLSFSVVERKGDHLRLYASFTDCDAMVRAQRKLEQNQREQQALMASIPGGVALYRLKKSGAVTTDYISGSLAKMCGYTHQEFSDYLKDNAMVNVRSEDVPQVMAAAQQSLRDHQPINLRYHIHTKNGPDILIRLDANRIEKSQLGPEDVAAWYAVHTLVSESSMRALAEQRRYRMILNMTETAYFEWERDGGFYASDKYTQYALSDGGYDAIMGWKDDENSVYPEDRTLLQSYVTNVGRKLDAPPVKLRMRMRDGSYRWTEITGYVERDAAGQISRLIGILRDVDNEWIEQNKRLQAALDEAQKANRAKSDFLSQMSHEIRTPMNGIIGMTKLAEESATDPKTREYLREIDESSQYMLGLLNDALDMSRIENGRLELNREWVNAIGTLESCIWMMEPMMRSKGIRFMHPDMSKASGVEYYMDPMRIKQVVMNLLNNAYKFTPEGGTVELKLENLLSDGTHGIDRLTIRDTGCGMSETFLKDGIFRPFSQEQNQYSATLHGTGLGLALVKEIVERMGGEISVSSKLGQGSEFVLRIPYEYRVAAPAVAEKKPEYDTGALRGKHVLLVDDHPLNRKIAKALLEKVGVMVEQAEDGQQAVTCYAASRPGWFDAILMDIRMPVMDGLEAARRIRALPRADARRVVVIAMTANAFEEDVRRSREAGMNVHLAKPVSPQLLYQTLLSALAG